LVRAYGVETSPAVSYKRLFVASDCSTRGEYVLPFAISVAQYYKSIIILGTVVEKPVVIQRLPLTEEEISLANQLAEINQQTAIQCHKQITTQLALKGIDVETHVNVADHAIGALHDMVEDVHADLVMLVAHGDWMPLGAADEQKPAADGTVEAWGRSPDNPVGGWYGLKKGFRGRFGMYVPPLLEALGRAEVEHNPRNNRMRAV